MSNDNMREFEDQLDRLIHELVREYEEQFGSYYPQQARESAVGQVMDGIRWAIKQAEKE